MSEALKSEIDRLRAALARCIANAGAPNAADGCRAVIETARQALGEGGEQPARPRVVCLCGSTSFRATYEQARYDEEHAGRIVLTVPCWKSDPCCKKPEDHARLDALHLAKIDLADEVLVIDGERPWCPTCQQHCAATGGSKSECHGVPIKWRPYVGDSTRKEIAYAEAHGKRVRRWSEERSDA